ncbi:MAG: HAMP domain-containing sensor histidine kinase [Draconibacterium sp.]
MVFVVSSLKSKIINKIIPVVLVFFFPPYIFSILRWLEVGWHDIFWVHSIVFIFIIFLTIYREKLTTQFKVYSLIVISAILGLTALWYFGFSGTHYFVIISVSLAAIYLERRTSIILVGILSAIYIAISVFYISGYQISTVDLNLFSHSILQWITIIFSLIAFSAVFIFGFGELYNELIHNIKQKTDMKNEREQYISELEIIQKRLDKTVQELSELNTAKNKLFSIVAHDLISPFNSILGFSQLLHDNYKEYDHEQREKFISFLHSEILNTYSLLEDLLLWARMQRNAVEFTSSNLNLFLLTTKISEALKNSAGKKSITISNQISHDIFIRSDGFMISTILRNLISNAIKFTPENGKVELTASELWDENEEKVIEVCVRDNGIGMTKETISKLFNAGENRSTPGTANEKGTGLGLPICYDFVKHHKGEIWVESEKGKGTAVYFSIPVTSNSLSLKKEEMVEL